MENSNEASAIAEDVQVKSIDKFSEQGISGEDILGGGGFRIMYCDSNGNPTTNASQASSLWAWSNGQCNSTSGIGVQGGGG